MLTFLHWWLSDGDVTRWYTASGTSPAALWSRATRAEWCSAGLRLPCGKGLMCEVLQRFEMAKDSQTNQDFAGDIAETKNREVCPFFAVVRVQNTSLFSNRVSVRDLKSYTFDARKTRRGHLHLLATDVHAGADDKPRCSEKKFFATSVPLRNVKLTGPLTMTSTRFFATWRSIYVVPMITVWHVRPLFYDLSTFCVPRGVGAFLTRYLLNCFRLKQYLRSALAPRNRNKTVSFVQANVANFTNVRKKANVNFSFLLYSAC